MEKTFEELYIELLEKGSQFGINEDYSDLIVLFWIQTSTEEIIDKSLLKRLNKVIESEIKHLKKKKYKIKK